MKILNITWPIIIGVTLLLYVLIIVSLPFSQTMALVFLLAVIGVWSRIPGVGIPHPFFILYQADVIDIFMLLISIHISPVTAILFVWFCNFSSRSAGVFPPSWGGTFHDSIIMTVLALLAPLFYAMFSGNIFVVIGVYSVLRIVGFIIMGFIWPIRSIPQLFFDEIGAGIAIFIINMFYAKMFGTFFEDMLIRGAVFNWTLFLVVTIVVLGILVLVYGFSPKRSINNAAKIGKKLFKKNLENKKIRKEDIDDDVRFVREALEKPQNDSFNFHP
ncbi:hypothetical protein H6503_06585 [Candidatus Woesearchaeota archaeon]|nr:hypothetical protein [Candidatus Woesearchaeota archaeon]